MDMNNDNGPSKIIRSTKDLLTVVTREDEITYRSKFLPDPTKLGNAKLVCTVCSKSVARDVHKGRKIFAHTFLQVLVCEDCHEFYGDGMFSADEDGDDKYCRWCGEGGTLYICCTCTGGFCKKCLKKNLKPSGLDQLDEDDWKCLMCNPRPIYGSRAIFWAAQEQNKIGKEKKELRLKMQEGRRETTGFEEIEFHKNHEKEESKSAKKRRLRIEDSDSSSVSIPTKKSKHDSESHRRLNGFTKGHKRKELILSSGDENTSVRSEMKSEDESVFENCKKRKKSSPYLNKNLKTKTSKLNPPSESEESLDNFSLKYSDSSSGEVSKKRKEGNKRYKNNSSGESSDEDADKKNKKVLRLHRKKHKKSKKIIENSKILSSTDFSSDSSSDTIKNKKVIKKLIFNEKFCENNNKAKSEKSQNENKFSNIDVNFVETIDQDNLDKKIDENDISRTQIDQESGETVVKEDGSNCNGAESANKLEDCDLNKIFNNLDSLNINSIQAANTLQNEITEELDSEEKDSTVKPQSDPIKKEIEKNIDLAIGWLNSAVKEISDLSEFVSDHSRKFNKKKVTIDSIKSYDNVLDTISKVRQLISGSHESYTDIETTLDENLKAWKIHTGLIEPDTTTPLEVNILPDPHLNDSIGEFLPNENSQVDNIESELSTEYELSQKTEVSNNEESMINDRDSAYEAIDSVPIPSITKTIVLDTLKEEILDTGDTKEETEVTLASESCCSVGTVSQDAQSTQEIEETENKKMILNKDINICLSENKEVGLNKENIHVTDVKEEPKENSDLSHTGDVSMELIDTEIKPEVLLDIVEKEVISVELSENKAQEICKDNGEDVEKDNKEDVSNKNASDNFEALQELLCSSSDDEVRSSSSDSFSSEEILLDDSDLDIKKTIKSITKKKKTVKKEQKRKDVKSENLEEQKKSDEDENVLRKDLPEEEKKVKEDKKLDSEEEIEKLTDLTKLKYKAPGRKGISQNDNEDSDSESDEDDDDEDKKVSRRKGLKYNNESKKRRELERNDLFGFLDGDTRSEDENDISKKDLDVIEDQYASSSSGSMKMEAFSMKMNAKWKELDEEQQQMNLQMLLATDSDEESEDTGEVLEPDDNKKKKKEKKIKEEEATTNNLVEEKTSDEAKESGNEEEEEQPAVSVKIEKEDEYEQFLEGLSKTKTQFKGLGSSSEDNISNTEDDLSVKEEPLSDDVKIKKEKNEEGDGQLSDIDSDNSGDLFMDKSKKKVLKKKSWRSNKLLHIKISETDTSDEERWWQKRLEKEKKREDDDNSDGTEAAFSDFGEGLTRPKKRAIPTERKQKKDKDSEKRQSKRSSESGGSSSSVSLSSSESSGSSVFKKKKKKKGHSSNSSDVLLVSEDEKKKKKKKKRMPLDLSDDSSGSDDSVINLSQKSKTGESPSKGGRKNIRKVKTKHELAAATKAAAREEEERKKRIAARQKLFNEIFEVKEAETLEKLVLDFDPDTKTELISVDKDLVVKMKPHQAKGVKFMWDSCFESLSQLKTKKGSGCILAHCMGLGKTFQVISLVHTILKHPDTHVNTVLVVCPLSTVLNWAGEFRKWLDDVAGGRDIKTYHLTTCKRPHERSIRLKEWQRRGGVMIIGYELFRILTNPNSKKFRLGHREVFQETLLDPGADLVVCDEGHMLKNESTLLSKAMSRIKTLRRIVLTGTPMQNNLKEYHCMVQFVKPNLLGTRKEFLNQFVNPITNGQFVDSTESDVKVMKRRAHVLHKMLEGLVQRFDYSVLTPFLPPKHEFVVSLRLSEVQVKLYRFYLDHFSQRAGAGGETLRGSGSQLFQDWQALSRIWTHPLVLKWYTDRVEKEREKARLEESGGEEGSLHDKSSLNLSTSHSTSSSSDGEGKSDEKKEKKKKEENKKKVLGPLDMFFNKEKLNIEKPTPVIVETEINLISSDEDEAIKIIENENKESTNNQDLIKSEIKEDIDLTNNGDQVEPEIKEKNTDLDEQNEIMESSVVENNKDSEIEDSSEKENKYQEMDNVEKETENKVEEEENKEENKENNVEENNLENGTKNKKAGEKQKDPATADSKGYWWKSIVDPNDFETINTSAKLIVLFAILRECEMIEDKVLVFSQSLLSLDLIEHFLKKIDQATEDNNLDESLGSHIGLWVRGVDYFRLDGSSSSENRSAWCKSFNRDDNPRARLFLISTRAGGLGINLTGANRVVIFDASWNPSHDIQSIFRIYRFGQKKPCYVYRFVAQGTMEEKVYERQVAKQSLSHRVVDEQQVHRHFSMNDLNELYTFTPPVPGAERPTPVLPKDRLMAELLKQFGDWIEKYHEHDSLLENVVEEELNEEERKLAWEDYENDKKRAVLPNPNIGVFGNMGVDMNNQREAFRRSLKMKYPNATEAELNAMVQTIMYQIYSNNQQTINNQQPINRMQQQHQAQRQLQAGQSTSTSQAPSHPATQSVPQITKTVMSAPLDETREEKYKMLQNMLMKKYGRDEQENRQQPRMGNSQIKQMNLNNTINAQNRIQRQQIAVQNRNQNIVTQNRNQNIRSQNRIHNQNFGTVHTKTPSAVTTGNDDYVRLMRMQQQANLERVQKYPNLQREMQMKQQQRPAPVPAHQQRSAPVPAHQQRAAPVPAHQQRSAPGHHSVLTTARPPPLRVYPSQQERHRTQNMVPNGQKHGQSNVPWAARQAPSVAHAQPNPQGLRTEQQIKQMKQERMQKRILQIKQQASLQEKMKQKKQAATLTMNEKSRKLEEMRKRYRSSRNKVPDNFEIVEIDDDPPGPS